MLEIYPNTVNLANHRENAAIRALRRQEMSEFGQDMPWLHDPDLIPDSAVETQPMQFADGGPFVNLGIWMTGQLTDVSKEANPHLDYRGAFEQHEVPVHTRTAVREFILNAANPAYGPGFQAMSEIFEVTPIDDVVDAARSSAERHLKSMKGTCLAMYVPLEQFGGISMYDAMWDAYGSAVSRLIYPTLSVEPVPADEPDPLIQISFDVLALRRKYEKQVEGDPRYLDMPLPDFGPDSPWPKGSW